MRFICDTTVGKLAKYLRIFGLDTVTISSPDELNQYIQSTGSPLLFTRRTKNISYRPMKLIKTNRIKEQIEEIEDLIKPYLKRKKFMTRCIECNSLLTSVEKKDIEALVPEYIYHNHEAFKICLSCKKVYWAGTHANKIKKRIKTLNLDVYEQKL